MNRRCFLSSSLLTGTVLLTGNVGAMASSASKFQYFGAGIYNTIQDLNLLKYSDLSDDVRSYVHKTTQHLLKDNIHLDSNTFFKYGQGNFLARYEKNNVLGFAQERGLAFIIKSGQGKFQHALLSSDLMGGLNRYVEVMEYGFKSSCYSINNSDFSLPEEIIETSFLKGKVNYIKFRTGIGSYLTIKEKNNNFVVHVSHLDS